MLRLESVGKRYGRGDWVLREVDLVVPPGEVLAVTGTNGSGKSTLLRLLVGLSVPTTGTVRGRPSVLGYVPERFPPGERMSALAYLTHLGRIRGLSTRVAVDRTGLLLERLGLVGDRNAPLRTLSKGNAQKVALAQALLLPPELLVLDEPWSGLDASAHGVLGEILHEVAAEGGAVVFTDHRESVPAARAYAVRGGRVVPSEQQPVLVEVVLSGDGGQADWHGLRGVREVAGRGSLITVRVTREHSDELLRTALGQGWSVEAVR